MDKYLIKRLDNLEESLGFIIRHLEYRNLQTKEWERHTELLKAISPLHDKTIVILVTWTMMIEAAHFIYSILHR